MPKLKSPLLSMGAKGTIGDALTFQKRGTGTIARRKPIPHDPYSLNQAYQRWDYRDYAYLWTLLSNSEKQVYRTKASRYHITGFSQWMRERLTDLDGLVGRWRLDERSGAIAYDSSKQGNNGTIFGATPTPGIIDFARYFDGLNDFITCPHTPSLDITGEFTIETWIKRSTTLGTTQAVIWKGFAGFDRQYALFFIPSNEFVLSYWTGAWRDTPSVATITDTLWHHLAATLDTSYRVRIYIDGIQTNTVLHPEGLKSFNVPLGIGARSDPSFEFHGSIDEISLRTFALTPTLVKRHSERRYPP